MVKKIGGLAFTTFLVLGLFGGGFGCGGSGDDGVNGVVFSSDSSTSSSSETSILTTNFSGSRSLSNFSITTNQGTLNFNSASLTLTDDGVNVSGAGSFDQVGFGLGSFSVSGTKTGDNSATLTLTGTTSNCSPLSLTGNGSLSGNILSLSVIGTLCDGTVVNTAQTIDLT